MSQPSRFLGIAILTACFSLPLLRATSSMAKDNAANEFQVMASNPSIELHERHIDGAALDSQKKAISSIRNLLKKYQGKKQEPLLLLRLVESEQEAAGIQYRIAHGPQNQNTGKAGHEFHKKIMRDLIADLTTLINRFPYLEEMGHIFYMRGNAYDELEMTAAATKDFLEIIANFRTAEDYMRACMSVAEIFIKAKDYSKAITYLKLVEKDPTDAHYPFALYKLGWAYYNLNEMTEALSHMSRVVRYYDKKNGGRDKVAASDNTNEALRENALLDISLFYFEGFEKKIDSYNVEHALSYFKDLDEGSGFGKMLVRFAKLLRSHGHLQELTSWKNQVLELARQESFEVLLVVYEDQSNHHDYKGILESAHDMVKFNRKVLDAMTLERGRKFLLDTAEELQGVILKNKNAEDLNQFSEYLAGVYSSFIDIVEDADHPGMHNKDPRIIKAHYNLAETLFQIKRFDQSTEHYRWIVDHLDNDKPEARDSSLKSIASRYELLKQKKLIPDALAAHAFPKPREDSESKLEPQLEEWIAWIDRHVSKYNDIAENFYFEANRCLYREGRLLSATKRMRQFAEKNPASKFAIPSAALVIDTHLASMDWEVLHEIATSFLKVKDWKGNPFHARVQTVDFGARYKIAEAEFAASDFKHALNTSESALIDGGGNEFLLMAAKSSLELQDNVKAEGFFTKLIQKAPHSVDAVAALLGRAALFEKSYQFAKAASDYRDYLESPTLKIAEKEIKNLQKRNLNLAWISGDAKEMQKSLSSKAICPQSGTGDKTDKGAKEDCESFDALATLQKFSTADKSHGANGDLTHEAEAAFQKAKKSALSEQAKTLWALIALQLAPKLGFRDRNAALRVFVAGFEELDPLMRNSLMHEVSTLVPNLFKLNRTALESVAPLGSSEKHIIHRIEMIREYENAATAAAKLPFARIKSLVLNELAWVYSDFAGGLKNMPAPKGVSGGALEDYQNLVQKILLPFEDKGAEIRTKAFELATSTSIEKDALLAISEPFMNENPSKAKALDRAPASVDISATVSHSTAKLLRNTKNSYMDEKVAIEDLDENGHWKILRANFTEPNNMFRFQFKNALAAQNWPLSAYLVQKSQEEDLVPVISQHFMKAVFFKKLGAQAEGLLELNDARKLQQEMLNEK